MGKLSRVLPYLSLLIIAFAYFHEVVQSLITLEIIEADQARPVGVFGTFLLGVSLLLREFIEREQRIRQKDQQTHIIRKAIANNTVKVLNRIKKRAIRTKLGLLNTVLVVSVRHSFSTIDGRITFFEKDLKSNLLIARVCTEKQSNLANIVFRPKEGIVGLFLDEYSPVQNTAFADLADKTLSERLQILSLSENQHHQVNFFYDEDTRIVNSVLAISVPAKPQRNQHQGILLLDSPLPISDTGFNIYQQQFLLSQIADVVSTLWRLDSDTVPEE